MTRWKGAGNPNVEEVGCGGGQTRECPICSEEYGSVPDHIRRDH